MTFCRTLGQGLSVHRKQRKDNQREYKDQKKRADQDLPFYNDHLVNHPPQNSSNNQRDCTNTYDSEQSLDHPLSFSDLSVELCCGELLNKRLQSFLETKYAGAAKSLVICVCLTAIRAEHNDTILPILRDSSSVLRITTSPERDTKESPNRQPLLEL